MKIVRAYAHEILNALGNTTISCSLELADGTVVHAAAPTGQSTGPFESSNTNAQPKSSLGSSESAQLFNSQIRPLLEGSEPNIVELDVQLLNQESSHGISCGANVRIATSQAIAKAQAYAHQISVFELLSYLCNYDTVSIPTPMFNCMNAGAHSFSPCPIQEILLLPIGYQTYAQALYATQSFVRQLKDEITAAGYPICIGDEGGFVIDVADERVSLDLVMQAVESSGYNALLALDVAAGQLYDPVRKQYRWADSYYSTNQLLEHLRELTQSYPLFSIEDPLAPQDNAWEIVCSVLSNVHIIADDLTATNSQRVQDSIQQYGISGAIIKPDQIGTVTQALQAATLVNQEDRIVIASHRSADTSDTFIVDFAVGVRALAIKAGGIHRAEHTAKYNRLLTIEHYLQQHAQAC